MALMIYNVIEKIKRLLHLIRIYHELVFFYCLAHSCKIVEFDLLITPTKVFFLLFIESSKVIAN